MIYVVVIPFLNLLCYCLYWFCCLIRRNSHLKVLLTFCNYLNVFLMFVFSYYLSLYLIAASCIHFCCCLFLNLICCQYYLVRLRFFIMFVCSRLVLFLDDIVIFFDVWVGVAILSLFLLGQCCRRSWVYLLLALVIFD